MGRVIGQLSGQHARLVHRQYEFESSPVDVHLGTVFLLQNCICLKKRVGSTIGSIYKN